MSCEAVNLSITLPSSNYWAGPNELRPRSIYTLRHVEDRLVGCSTLLSSPRVKKTWLKNETMMSFAQAKTLLPSRFPPPPPARRRPSLRFLSAATAVGTDSAGENAATASKTTARERRLVKVREERRRREYDRENTYPGWAKYATPFCLAFSSLPCACGYWLMCLWYGYAEFWRMPAGMTRSSAQFLVTASATLSS
jgi:hypothetical protein